MNGALLSSKKMDYCTPKEFFAELDKEFHFALDAAATEASAKCAAFYTPENDGLTKPWNIAGGAVFCNPPYGREIGKWVRKAYGGTHADDQPPRQAGGFCQYCGQPLREIGQERFCNNVNCRNRYVSV